MKFTLCLAILLAAVSARAATEIHVLNVGYGSAVHVHSEGRDYLFDAGPPQAASVLLRHFSEEGVTGLTAIFISHAHLDHIGALPPLLKQMSVQKIFWNGRWPEDDDLSQIVDQIDSIQGLQVFAPGQKLALGPTLVVAALPLDIKTDDMNDNSLVLMLEEQKKTRVLLPGDIGLARQQSFAPEVLANVKWMLWPHHGDTLDMDFMSALGKLDFCAISVGLNNYNLPADTLTEQMKKICQRVERTDKHGELRYFFDKRGVGREKTQ